jgi:predicted DNA-binding ribbon-helix-helix protein
MHNSPHPPLTKPCIDPPSILPQDRSIGLFRIKPMCQIFAGQDPDRYETVTRRLRLNGQSTSIRLERAFWRILDDIAARQGVTTPAFISKLHAEVLELHGEARNFTSLLRCACTIHLGEDQFTPTAIAAE